MRIVSWNVNGLRAVIKKGALDRVDSEDLAAICLQETRCDLGTEDAVMVKMHSSWHRGYWATGTAGRSGTAIFTRGPSSLAPRRSAALYDEDTGEGRVTSVLIETKRPFVLMSCYAPNTGREHRSREKHDWMQRLTGEVCWLQREHYPVILCGDWNAILDPEDVHDFKGTSGTPGNYDFERDDLFDTIDSASLVDAWRTRNPEARRYTYWDYRTAARRRGLGWRIDSFLVDECIFCSVSDAQIHDTIEGSDHCPISINISEE